MQRDAHILELCTLLQHDEVAATIEQRLDISEKPNPTIIIEERYEPSSLVSGKAETNIHEEKCKSLQDYCCWQGFWVSELRNVAVAMQAHTTPCKARSA